MAANTLQGDCTTTQTATFTAQATANGPSKPVALSRAREQAQTLLDSYMANNTSCPQTCPVKNIDAEPDYDAALPTYTTAPDAPDVFICTAVVGRVVHLSCGTDGSTSSDGG
jgi:hypothetical protein